MDTANLIEEAERWAKNVSESPGNGTAGEDLYGAKLLCDLAAALKASEERARKAEKTQEQLYDEWREELLVSERERDAIAAANLAANKRIVELEHERDEARSKLSRLTTPRPIVEAPRDGTWVLLPFSTSKWDACRGPSPQYVTARWFAAAWADPNGALLTEPSHYLPLPDVKP